MGNEGGTSLIRGEKILTYIGHIGSASFMQLVRYFSFPKSSTFTLLKIMCESGLLVKNDNNQYSLGLKIYELGCQSIHKRNIFEITKRPMNELATKSGLICHLGTIEQNHAIYLDKIESSDSTPTGKSWIGKKLELHITALGKALLAWKKDNELKYYLNSVVLTSHTKNTITKKEDFIKELKVTKSRGWAIDREESTDGAVCISAPIFDISNRVNYAISLSGNSNIFSSKDISNYIYLVKKYAHQISIGFGYRNNMNII